jgi:hypothetical protein
MTFVAVKDIGTIAASGSTSSVSGSTARRNTGPRRSVAASVFARDRMDCVTARAYAAARAIRA